MQSVWRWLRLVDFVGLCGSHLPKDAYKENSKTDQTISKTTKLSLKLGSLAISQALHVAIQIFELTKPKGNLNHSPLIKLEQKFTLITLRLTEYWGEAWFQYHIFKRSEAALRHSIKAKVIHAVQIIAQYDPADKLQQKFYLPLFLKCFIWLPGKAWAAWLGSDE